MPYNPKEYLPHIYGKFREKNAAVPVRQLVDSPKLNEMPFVQIPQNIINDGIKFMPNLKDFGFSDEEINKK